MSAVPHHVWTEKEYLKYERIHEIKHEFYQGTVYAMAGASPNHVLIATNTSTSLNIQLRREPCRVYQTDLRLSVSAVGLYTYPDVMVVCGTPQFADSEQDTLLNPILTVEVLSPSTEKYDRGEKFQLYKKLVSLREYVLIAQDTAKIECYSRQADDQWIPSEAVGLEATIELASVTCTLQLADVYEKVSFENDQI